MVMMFKKKSTFKDNGAGTRHARLVLFPGRPWICGGAQASPGSLRWGGKPAPLPAAVLPPRLRWRQWGAAREPELPMRPAGGQCRGRSDLCLPGGCRVPCFQPGEEGAREQTRRRDGAVRARARQPTAWVWWRTSNLCDPLIRLLHVFVKQSVMVWGHQGGWRPALLAPRPGTAAPCWGGHATQPDLLQSMLSSCSLEPWTETRLQPARLWHGSGLSPVWGGHT